MVVYAINLNPIWTGTSKSILSICKQRSNISELIDRSNSQDLVSVSWKIDMFGS
jgi:hypothetical protein